jgi:DNA-binding winged helix-turn-helix (wHTH) protein/TolB-like protein
LEKKGFADRGVLKRFNKMPYSEMSEIYEFADFRIDVRERVLERMPEGERVALPEKAYDTLCVLVRNAGRLVAKDEILSEVWADSFVEENNLNKSIHAIRRALGENSGGEKFIETVKKHGFRFLVEVRRVQSQPASTETSTSTGGRVTQLGTVREFLRPVSSTESRAPGPALAMAVPAEPETVKVSTAPIADQPQVLRPVPDRAAVVRGGRFALYPAVIAGLLLAAVVAGALIYRYASSTGDGSPTSLAVLPLKPLDASDNYLGLGVADAIIRRISQAGTLTVRPTSSVRRYLNEETDALTAARALGVDVVLEGTVQRSDDRLRVSVNLLRTSDGKSLWADNFDMRSSDAFTIQDKVAQQVATSLRLRLDRAQSERYAARYSPNAIAYEYYLKGVYSFEQRGFDSQSKPQMETTIELFKKAIAADPNYALAHAQLAYAYAWMSVYIEPMEQAWVTLAKEGISRAEELDPQQPEIHVARHHILLSAHEGYQTEAAIRELLLAQRINPNIGHDDLAVDYAHIGLEDLFDREANRAMAIDPTSEYFRPVIANQFLLTKRFDDWLAFAEKDVDGKPEVRYLLGVGRWDEAQALIEQGLAKSPDDPVMRLFRGTLMALKGDHRAAESEIPFVLSQYQFKRRYYHHVAYDVACIYAMAGNSAEAVKWLRETAATGFPNYPLFERDNYLDRIREAPEFVQFMTEMRSRNERARQEFEQ